MIRSDQVRPIRIGNLSMSPSQPGLPRTNGIDYRQVGFYSFVSLNTEDFRLIGSNLTMYSGKRSSTGPETETSSRTDHINFDRATSHHLYRPEPQLACPLEE